MSYSVLQLLDHFELASPYMGLIFPVMGMDLRSRVDIQHGQRLPKQVALNSAVTQNYEDLYSKNVLYSAPAVSQLSEDEIMARLGKPIFEIITGRTFMDSFLADRMDMIVDLKRALGQPPSKWHDGLESNVRNMLDSTPARDVALYQYLELNYNQDDAKLLALDDHKDEEDIPIEESEKLSPEFTETDPDVFDRDFIGTAQLRTPKERCTSHSTQGSFSPG
ncbi:hypothetical protein AJ78_01007 [Emergomyces pasteurianus Ep9510]|uniref:Uncharacterized protein n=1 Tax=Emergomyces pasteurianus Ep9510 TaxID=1447872 RepID=A0A1J9QFM0_9EURO|nr:hypothetical protein AJ78_01007 [Emergomyces pasteurianus Ep9510]